MHRNPESHKGDNGVVAVIGGSRNIHGAPVFSALAAEASGVDLVFALVPRCHEEVTKQASLNVQVHPFEGDELADNDLPMIMSMLATMDCAVIGPGIGRGAKTLKALRHLIAEVPCPLVLDACALQPWTIETIGNRPALLTPHLGELERMGIAEGDQARMIKGSGLTMLTKGPIDSIHQSDGSVITVEGGNAGLTVGGTGDALAGLCAGLIAQGMTIPSAAALASLVIKRAGAMLFPQFGIAYGTSRVITMIPQLLTETLSTGS